MADLFDIQLAMDAQKITIIPQKIAVVCRDSRRTGVEERRRLLDAALDCERS